MLILSRKTGEKIHIGDNVTVVVSRISGNRVTLGVSAPAEMRIVRGELEPEVPVGVTAGQTAAVPTEVPAAV